MSNKEDFIEIKDLDSIKRALENAEIDYDELTANDGTGYLIETVDVQFEFDADGNMLNVEALDRPIQ